MTITSGTAAGRSSYMKACWQNSARIRSSAPGFWLQEMLFWRSASLPIKSGASAWLLTILECGDRSSWQGQNLLGYTLMKVRRRLEADVTAPGEPALSCSGWIGGECQRQFFRNSSSETDPAEERTAERIASCIAGAAEGAGEVDIGFGSDDARRRPAAPERLPGELLAPERKPRTEASSSVSPSAMVPDRPGCSAHRRSEPWRRSYSFRPWRILHL